jgi:hypothetical protein
VKKESKNRVESECREPQGVHSPQVGNPWRQWSRPSQSRMSRAAKGSLATGCQPLYAVVEAEMEELRSVRSDPESDAPSALTLAGR